MGHSGEHCRKEVIILLLGNKADLEDQRAVTRQTAREFAEQTKLSYYEVSAKEGTNISLVFHKISERTSPSLRTRRPHGSGGGIIGEAVGRLITRLIKEERLAALRDEGGVAILTSEEQGGPGEGVAAAGPAAAQGRVL
ncbi:unnamed protein product [Sphagnum balticum]